MVRTITDKEELRSKYIKLSNELPILSDSRQNILYQKEHYLSRFND